MSKDSDRWDYARIIFNSGQMLLTLLNDILDLSKVEAGKIRLESIALNPGHPSFPCLHFCLGAKVLPW